MPAQDRIEINPKVMLGKPVIRGTRVTVELILRKLGEGATSADLIEAYPHLAVEDIRAAITYAETSWSICRARTGTGSFRRQSERLIVWTRNTIRPCRARKCAKAGP